MGFFRNYLPFRSICLFSLPDKRVSPRRTNGPPGAQRTIFLWRAAASFSTLLKRGKTYDRKRKTPLMGFFRIYLPFRRICLFSLPDKRVSPRRTDGPPGADSMGDGASQRVG
nr:MAG TPA: hypothetical protein [Caudoviricetes sp.]